ncbi:MAG: type II toxin-antitoxin system RelE/ParE family toxin [Blastocatellia bacterium]
MNNFKVSELAQDDLISIYEYIAAEDEDAATRLMQAFREKFHLLAQFPNMGRERNELLLYLRSFPVGRYLVFYQPTDDGIEVLRVQHSARDLRGLFDF